MSHRSFIKMLYLLLFIASASLSPSPSSSAAFSPQYDSDIRGAVAQFWPEGPDWTWWKAQLYQESRLDPQAMSPVGARGLAQTMPATWAEITRQLHWGNVSPHSPRHAIYGGAYYMRRMQLAWTSRRTIEERQKLAQASYNAGTGHIIEAQDACHGALTWDRIWPCLAQVTGQENAQQTIDYVTRIAAWRRQILSTPH
ncbi:MAG TPA: transglycosylase SLT domain-containing protein [Dongiaceae bacterium]|nr:transglycosylase SLT domain-containing protein [Dongiaceae bacterium]